MSIEVDDIRQIVSGVFPSIRDLRRDIHMHPEIKFEEVRTGALVVEHLKRLKIPHRAKVGRTGVVALIEGAKPGRCVALRADMDALPMTEKNDLPYRSVNAGRMHACGHDGHTANLVGVAHVLSRLKGRFAGSVKLLFQPAEEAGEQGGAELLVKAGALRNPKPDVIFALHIDHAWPLGSIACTAGPCAASADFFDIIVRGRGCHAAEPHKGIDPIVIAGAISQSLQTIRSRRIDPLRPVVVTVGRIAGGSARNVIPDEVTLGGTCRAYDRKVRRAVARELERISHNVARAMGGSAEVRWVIGYAPVVNDEKAAAFLCETAAEALGKKNVHKARPSMGGEDFSFYLDVVPGAFAWLGNGSPARPLHNASFDFNDEALKSGMLLMSALAVRWMEKH